LIRAAPVNTMSMTTMTIIDVTTVFSSTRRRMFLIFAEPELRPPVYDEMVRDMGNIINKVAANYVDPSCVALHFEEIVAECWAKTTEMNTDGLLERCRTRSEYFRVYKTAIANHVCSLVQRHIFTEKRTGVKPPPKHKRHERQDHGERVSRPMEVRIDDPDANVQISEIECGDDSTAFRELLEEVATRLTDAENLVLQQLLSPNEAALFFARMEGEIGRMPNDPVRIRIRYEHLAQGVGLSLEVFRQLHESIKEKCLFMKSHRELDDPHYTAAMATLLQFFNVQIPRSIDETTQKRALLIAAQHQYDRFKENDGIKKALETCGIPVPEVRNDRYRCFGVMFQKHHRTCENCAAKEACELKATNFGLGEITISQKLLGSRHARVPVVAPTRRAIDSAITDERDEEILSFLDENFRRVTQDGTTLYRHKDRTAETGGTSNEPMIFSIGHSAPMRLRFISPAEELKRSLRPESGQKGGRPSWCLPNDLDAEEAINLIRAHAQMTFTKV
jgi:hypothetical protein